MLHNDEDEDDKKKKKKLPGLKGLLHPEPFPAHPSPSSHSVRQIPDGSHVTETSELKKLPLCYPAACCPALHGPYP